MPAPLWRDLTAWRDDCPSRRSMALAGRIAWMTATRSSPTVLGGTRAGAGVAQVTPDRGGWGAATTRVVDSRDSRDFSICYSLTSSYTTALSQV
jgi:hypothetical protein